MPWVLPTLLVSELGAQTGNLPWNRRRGINRIAGSPLELV